MEFTNPFHLIRKVGWFGDINQMIDQMQICDRMLHIVCPRFIFPIKQITCSGYTPGRIKQTSVLCM